MSSVPVPEEYIKAIITKVAVLCNFVEWQYMQTKFECIAQNYFGLLIPVVLTGVTNGEHLSIPLVLKLAPIEEQYRVSGAVTLMFAREIFVYSVILQKYRMLQISSSIQYIIPKCYYICKEYCKEAIAMQDMRENGYRPFTHSFCLDLDHISISAEALAKFHSLSFILRDKDLKLYKEAEKVCVPLSGTNNKRYIEVLKDRLTKALQIFNNTQYVTLLEKLIFDCERLIDAAYNSVEETCICHGDIWKENILFKYENNIPVSACLIDYQTTRTCSPAFDILYLVISSTDTDLRHRHFDKLLDIYFKMFDQTLKSAGLESQTMYSRKAFDKDLKVVGPACFIVANTAMWLSNGLQQEGHIRSKDNWTTEEEMTKAVDKYKGIIKGIMDDLIARDYL